MSVIIKDMDMPKSCFKCEIYCRPYFSSDKVIFTQRLANCPLVALPKNHSRLIDGDYLVDKLKALGLKDENVFRIIKEEPTVIESEE